MWPITLVLLLLINISAWFYFIQSNQLILINKCSQLSFKCIVCEKQLLRQDLYKSSDGFKFSHEIVQDKSIYYHKLEKNINYVNYGYSLYKFNQIL